MFSTENNNISLSLFNSNLVFFRVRGLYSLPDAWSTGQSPFNFTVATSKPGTQVCFCPYLTDKQINHSHPIATAIIAIVLAFESGRQNLCVKEFTGTHSGERAVWLSLRFH